MWENQSTFNASSLLTCIKNKLKVRFLSFWNKRLNSDDGMEKLRTYKLIKQKFELEPYLEVLTDRKQRKALTAIKCIRISLITTSTDLFLTENISLI